MPQIIFSLAAALIAFWVAHGYLYPAIFPSRNEDVSGLSLEETIAQVKRELAEIGSTPGPTAGLELKDVALELTTQRDDKQGRAGELVVPVFKEASVKGEASTKITTGSKIAITFVPPPGEELLAAPKPGQLDLSDLVLSARKALVSASADASGTQLTPKSVEIEVNFVLVKAAGASSAIKAYVVNIGSSTEKSETGGNKITLHYRNPKLAEKDAGEQEKPVPPR